MKEGGTSLNKTFREYNLVFKRLTEVQRYSALNAAKQRNNLRFLHGTATYGYVRVYSYCMTFAACSF